MKGKISTKAIIITILTVVLLAIATTGTVLFLKDSGEAEAAMEEQKNLLPVTGRDDETEGNNEQVEPNEETEGEQAGNQEQNAEETENEETTTNNNQGTTNTNTTNTNTNTNQENTETELIPTVIGTRERKIAEGLSLGWTTIKIPSIVSNLDIFKPEISIEKTATRVNDEKIKQRVGQCTDQRLFAIFQAIKRNILTTEEIHNITKIDMWFLEKLKNIADMEKTLQNETLTVELYKEAKDMGFPDSVIQNLSGTKITGASGILKEKEEAAELRKNGKLAHLPASYKMVDTCAGEFNAETPYFYGTYDSQNEAQEFIAEKKSDSTKNSKGTIVVLGSGPIRIGHTLTLTRKVCISACCKT